MILLGVRKRIETTMSGDASSAAPDDSSFAVKFDLPNQRVVVADIDRTLSHIGIL